MITRMEKDRMLKWVAKMFAREIREGEEDKDMADSDYYLVEQIVRLIEAA